MKRTEEKVREIAEGIWQQRSDGISESIREKVKRGLDDKLNDASVMNGLRLDDTDDNVADWIDDLIEGEEELINEGLR
jgi:hypothetical protein